MDQVKNLKGDYHFETYASLAAIIVQMLYRH